MFKKRVFFCKNNQKSKENCFYIFLYSKYVLSLHRFIRQLLIHLKEYFIMKKKYTQPDILCEKLASCNVIMTSYIDDSDADGSDALAPKRQGIWKDED